LALVHHFTTGAEVDRVEPNLFIVGAPKCGTTAWVEYLGSHPDIFFPARKEPSFFCPDLLPRQRVQTLDEYLALFAGSGDPKIVGEASPTYLRSEQAPRRIAEFNPAAKILIFLRDQEDFLPSLHNQLVFNGEEPIDDFEKAWRLSGKRRREDVPEACNDLRLLDYRTAGRFGEQVDRYFGSFPAHQIRLFHFRDWVAHPRAVYLEILGFLGLADDGRGDFRPINEARQRRTNFFVKLVNAPPPGGLMLVSILKRLTGSSSLGLAHKLREIGARPGYSSVISDELRQEIRDLYAEDNCRLLPRQWRAPATATEQRQTA
jgi:Sulfotransferase domain